MITSNAVSKTPPSILIVDDVPTNLEVLSTMLNQWGYTPRPVTNGRIALESCQQEPPDLILLDINMPEMDGYEVCRRLKSDHKMKDIPVIFLSALAETIDKLRAFSVGGVDYITKPFHCEEVEARVHTHLELRRQQLELLNRNDQLQKLEEQRDNLTHMIVHDMRSPLTAVSGFLSLLKKSDIDHLSTQGKRCIELADAATAKLIELATAVLDVSKAEAGEMKLQRLDGDLAALVRNVMAKFESLKGDRQLILEVLGQPVQVWIDTEIIERVLQNLLGNALNFTLAQGTVRMVVSHGAVEARFTITDNGPGIAAQYHQKIFEKFGQVDSHRVKRGTGLGLTFCKLAVEAHGGCIGVESEAAKGSTFWFTLPVAPNRAAAAP